MKNIFRFVDRIYIGAGSACLIYKELGVGTPGNFCLYLIKKKE
jgi:hypothetical protein